MKVNKTDARCTYCNFWKREQEFLICQNVKSAKYKQRTNHHNGCKCFKERTIGE